MARNRFLGELEQLVVLTVIRLGDEAYGMEIRREIADRTGRDVAIGAVYSALDRMERKGLVSSRVGQHEPTPGGRARRVFSVEEKGREALTVSLQNVRSLARGPDIALGDG